MAIRPFTLDVSSGILVLAWSRIEGATFFRHARDADPAAIIHQRIGPRLAAPLAPYDGSAPSPLAWGFRVQPGTYHCALRFLGTHQRVSAMVLSHVEAPPLWNDQVASSSHAHLGGASPR